jgi:hypothetical protein
MIGAEKFRRWLQRPVLAKKDSEAPDMTEMVKVGRDGIAAGKEMFDRQQSFTEKSYAENKPMFDQIVRQQLDMSNQTQQQGKDYYDYQVKTFRPLEQRMVSDAENFNTDGYREQQASKAAADVGKAYSASQGAMQRSMMSMGVNPNSGKFASMQNQNALGLSAQRANAMTGARQQAEQMGWARRSEAAGLGRNLAGNANAAYGVALNSGNAAGNNQLAPQNQYMNGLNSAQKSQMDGYTMGANTFGNANNIQAGMYNSDTNATGEMWGAVLGAGGTLASAGLKR